MRRAALTFAFVLAGCQAFLVFDQKDKEVIFVGADADGVGGDVAADVGSGDGRSETDAADATHASESPPDPEDPCERPTPDSGISLVYCDRFDEAGAGSWTSMASNGGFIEIDMDASASDGGGSLHTVAQENQGPSIDYDNIQVITPGKLRVAFDYSLTTVQHGMAIAHVRFGKYLVRVVATNQGVVGYDEYNDRDGGGEFEVRLGQVAVGADWKHLALELVITSKVVESATFWVDGAWAADSTLHATDYAAQGIQARFGAVDYSTADMHFDNVRITTAPYP